MKEVEEGNCCFLNLILNSRFSFGLETTKFGVYLLCLQTIYSDDDGVAVFS